MWLTVSSLTNISVFASPLTTLLPEFSKKDRDNPFQTSWFQVLNNSGVKWTAGANVEVAILKCGSVEVA